MKRFQLSALQALSELPSTEAAAWLAGAEDSVTYLKENSANDEILIYASGKSVLVHGVLALHAKVTPPDGQDLQHAMFPQTDDSWVIQRVWGGGKGHRMYLEPPLTGSSKSFEGGEKLIFRRSFNDVKGAPSRIELSQKLVHSLDLYFVEERKAFCRLDSRGDIEDVIKIIQIKSEDEWGGTDVVTILWKDLEKFMALSGTALVWRFDFTRVRWGSFGGWGDIRHFDKSEPDVFYHGGQTSQGSFVNGALIVRPKITIDDLVQAWKDEEDKNDRQYATFKIHDRKNKVDVETSCGPEHLSNYFQKSGLPWEISPAFFRPEVLRRFKADAEKYTLEDRSITCRGAWYLKSYDISEAGQVHVYIGDLANLPYEEQLYWQSFNEWPKGSISERALQTDILGEWDTGYDPLNAIKRTVTRLDKLKPAWWTARGETLADATRYPATDSPDEWADEIMALDQFLTEGFLVKPLRAMALSGGRKVESTWGSLKVLLETLLSKGINDDDAKGIVAPLQKLHALRTEVRGHASLDKRKKAISEARSTFGTLRSHFTHICSQSDRALNQIVKALGIPDES